MITLVKPSHPWEGQTCLRMPFLVRPCMLFEVRSWKVAQWCRICGLLVLACLGLQHLPSLFSGSRSHAMMLPDKHSGLRAECQGGILNCVPASPLLPIWVPVETSHLLSPTLMGLCLQGHRDWPAKECGSQGWCQSCWGRRWTTGIRGACESSLPPGFSGNQTLSGNLVAGVVWNCSAGSSWGSVKSQGRVGSLDKQLWSWGH